MWMACHTQEEIAKAAVVSPKTVDNKTEEFVNFQGLGNLQKVTAHFNDEKFTQPLFNSWRFSKINNEVAHFGHSEQTIVENLLYLYTEPFNIVLDPFAGGRRLTL